MKKQILSLAVGIATIFSVFAKTEKTELNSEKMHSYLIEQFAGNPQLTSTNNIQADTSSLDIVDTLDLVCPNLPDAKRFKSGREFWSDYIPFDSLRMEQIEHWVEDFPKEADEFNRVVSPFIDATDVTTLSYSQKRIYYDIRAQWIVVKHGNH